MKAVSIHGVPVEGYTAWSLMDNFEWSRGYTERFGLHWVNFDSPNKERIPKASSYFYQQLVRHNGYPNLDEVERWESEAMDECKTYTAMALASSSSKSVYSMLLLIII